MTNDYEQIDQYVNGELTGEALADFEAKLLTDKALAEEGTLYKDVDDTLMTAYAYKEEDAALEQTFNQFGKKYFTESTTTIQEADSTKIKRDNTKVVQLQPAIKENPKGNWSGFSWLRPAIGLAVAALIALLIFQPWQRSLIDSYYEPYALEIMQRNGMTALTQAQKAYNSGDYASALPVFEKYPNHVEVQITKGNAEYNLGKTNEAITTFQQIASGNSVYVATANWYLALAYLKQEQPEKAKAALDKIPEGSSYYTKAQELRAKI